MSIYTTHIVPTHNDIEPGPNLQNFVRRTYEKVTKKSTYEKFTKKLTIAY